MKKNNIFISSTSTNAGKTYFSKLLFNRLIKQGINVGYMKPFQTGVQSILDNKGDFQYVVGENIKNLPLALDSYVPYIYNKASSVHLAAEYAKLPYPDIELIQDRYKRLTNSHDFIIVEGAGGLFSPINREETVVDLVSCLDLRCIMVIPNILGTISQSISCLNLGKHSKMNFLGFILNNISKTQDADIMQDNSKTIHQFTDINFLGYISNNEQENHNSIDLLDDICEGIING